MSVYDYANLSAAPRHASGYPSRARGRWPLGMGVGVGVGMRARACIIQVIHHVLQVGGLWV